ncbi:phage tail assembly chaperone GT [Priestia megaterium]|uniref:phage tail assembly chaperone GT n=1 Tax=Priestia megaterium TaxID=1404 RepID=UPI00159BAD45|nr:hypothetical protein [Priestia megaterium]
MDDIALNLMENGKDINEILDMPLHYVIELFEKKNKPKQEQSLIVAFSPIAGG